MFVDGRTDLYDDAFLREYLQVSLGRGYAEVFARYDVQVALIETDSLLGDALRRDAAWRVAYTDAVATVFAKVNP